MSKKRTPKELASMRHVVRSINLQGRWGRGWDMLQAMRNAGIKLSTKEPFDYYIFANDDWDVLATGTITWPKDSLVFKQTVNEKR